MSRKKSKSRRNRVRNKTMNCMDCGVLFIRKTVSMPAANRYLRSFSVARVV